MKMFMQATALPKISLLPSFNRFLNNSSFAFALPASVEILCSHLHFSPTEQLSNLLFNNSKFI
ncbi:unnamed protein product [Amoebophrya sp. A25]|nr:unnamed protein product [Amoebophrya sp. A25]|eukprot:GSA25T00027684001.1